MKKQWLSVLNTKVNSALLVVPCAMGLALGVSVQEITDEIGQASDKTAEILQSMTTAKLYLGRSHGEQEKHFAASTNF